MSEEELEEKMKNGINLEDKSFQVFSFFFPIISFSLFYLFFFSLIFRKFSKMPLMSQQQHEVCVEKLEILLFEMEKKKEFKLMIL